MNLASAIFPFHTDMWGRSIILPQYDQNYDSKVLSTGADTTEKDKGIPQAFYMHNVTPTVYGYQSIGYDTMVAGIADTMDFDFCYPLQNPQLGRFLFSPAAGKNYVYDQTVGTWESISPIPSGTIPESSIVTTAYVHGQTYICYERYHTYKYNEVTKVMDLVVLSGLVDANVKGVCAANGYMLVWDDVTVSWSNATNETDFVPSLITGAGGGSVNDAKGRIIVCLPISGGFLVYCEKNIVAAKYTGNINFPYIFTEVPGSAGITSPNQVSWRSNLAKHYAWTSAGMQMVDKSQANDLLPEVTDFLAAKIFEDFDEATLTLNQSFLGTQLNVAVAVVAQRFVIVSYGVSPPEFTHALLYDLSLKRWGKLKIQHRSCFQWNVPNLYGAITYGQLINTTYGDLINTTYGELLTSIDVPEQPRKTIAFLQMDGTVKLVNFDLSEESANGVLIIGKFQFQRNFWITHQNTDIETVYAARAFKLYLMSTLDGKDLQSPVEAVVLRRNAKNINFVKRLAGQNISLVLLGAFASNCIVFNFTQGGQR
jgi:hypothetical protein